MDLQSALKPGMFANNVESQMLAAIAYWQGIAADPNRKGEAQPALSVLNAELARTRNPAAHTGG